MAGSLIHTCPGCGAENIALTIVFARRLRVFGAEQSPSGQIWWVCPRNNCQTLGGAMVHSNTTVFDANSAMSADITDRYEIKNFWPSPPDTRIPKHLPPSVMRAYKQGEDNFNRPDNFEASGTMYGRALELAVKSIDENGKGTLAKRIKSAAAKNLVTQSIADWANEIRFLRNDAVHDLDGITKEELDALRGITEMVLRYVFTLPGMVKELRGEDDGPQAAR